MPYDWVQVATFVVQVLLFGGLIWYTCETWRIRKTSQEQANIMQRQLKAAEREVVLLNRAYLTVDSWMSNCPLPNMIGAKFRIYNPSLTAARIEDIEFKCGPTTTKLTCGRLLTPKEGYWVTVPPEEVELEGRKAFLISGRITYTDIFRRERHRKFAQNCLCVHSGSYSGASFSDVEGVGWNDEEEWDKEENPN